MLNLGDCAIEGRDWRFGNDELVLDSGFFEHKKGMSELGLDEWDLEGARRDEEDEISLEATFSQ